MTIANERGLETVETLAEKVDKKEKASSPKGWKTISSDLESKVEEARRRRKERDELLKAAVAANPNALRNITPVSIAFELIEGTDTSDPSIFMKPCVKVAPVVHPLMDACLQKVGLTPRGRRTYSMSVGENASSKSMLAALEALPWNLVYDPELLEQVEKQGNHMNNHNSIYQISQKLMKTTCGAAAGYGVQQALSGYRQGMAHTAAWNFSAIQLASNDKEMFIKFVTFGPKPTKGIYLYEGAPNLNLLKRENTHDPIRVTADVAVSLYGAAQAYGFDLADYPWLADIAKLMGESVIAQMIPGSPGEARLIVGQKMKKPKGLTFAALHGFDEAEVAVATCDEVGKIIGKVQDDGTHVILHPSVADVIAMTTTPVVEYPGLKPYQNEVVRRHLATKIGFVNVSATGLGKTVMTLRACEQKAQIKAEAAPGQSYKSLIVMQKTLLPQWAGEARRHFKDATVIKIESSAPSKLKKVQEQIEACTNAGTPFLALISYETVKNCVDFLKQWFLDDLVVDEAVVLVSTSADRSKALWELRGYAKCAVALTGTPIERSLDDMGRMLAWARNDEEMFYGKRLSQRFDVTIDGDMARMWKAIGPTVVRFDRSELKDMLPTIETEVLKLKSAKVELALSDGARRHLKKIYLKMVEKLEKMEALSPNDPAIKEAKEDLKSARGAVLGGVTLARIAASDPVAVAASESIGAALLEAEGLIEPAAKHGGTKRRYVSKLVAKHVAKNDSVIIFTDFSSVAENLGETLEDAGLRVGLFTGKMKDSLRQEAKERFQGVPCARHEEEMEPGAVMGCAECTQPDLDVLVLTKAACKGLNLQRANVLVHYDLPWLPSDVIQRLGRASRYGQKANVLHVYIPLMAGTIEERVAALLLPRAVVAMQALDGYRGVDARDTEIGMSIKGLAENVSLAEQGDKVSIFDLAKELLKDDEPKKAPKPKASHRRAAKTQAAPALATA